MRREEGARVVRVLADGGGQGLQRIEAGLVAQFVQQFHAHDFTVGPLGAQGGRPGQAVHFQQHAAAVVHRGAPAQTGDAGKRLVGQAMHLHDEDAQRRRLRVREAGGEPRTLPLKRMLQIFIEHRQTVITRRSKFDLAKAQARLHILDGYLIALNNIDAIIKVIREAEDVDTAKANLVKRFKLSEVQAQAILDMQLRRLAALERWKIEEEHKQVRETIAYLEDLLAHPKKILALIKSDLNELAETYGDDRRTRIAAEAQENIHEEDLVPDESVLISLTERGYIKRVAANAFKSQSRGGRGVMGHTTKDEDEVMMLIPARSLNTMLFFSDKGKVYSEKVYQIPDSDRATKGIPLVNVLSLDPNEKITAAMAVGDFSSHNFCMLMTSRGKIKRVSMARGR